MERDINNDSGEISLLDLISVLWRWKWLIIGMTALISVSVFAYVFIGKKMAPEKSYMPDIYTSTAFMRIRRDAGAANSALASILQQRNLSNVAELTDSRIVLYIAGSNSFLDTIADELRIAEKYKIQKLIKTETRAIAQGLFKAKIDEKSGVFSLSASHFDPEFAQKAVLVAVDYYKKCFEELGVDKKVREKEILETNLEQSFNEIKRLEQELDNLETKKSRSGGEENVVSAIKQIKREIAIQEQVYGQLKVQYELLKVAIASEDPVFQILAMPEIPEVPEMKSGQSRIKICIIAFVLGLFFSIFLAFLLNALQEIWRDPSVRAKFLSKKEKHRES